MATDLTDIADRILLTRNVPNPTTNPPDDWENMLIPPGVQPLFEDGTQFAEKWPVNVTIVDGVLIDLDTGKPAVPKMVLEWRRVYHWLPKGRFCIQQLQHDSSWKNTGVIIPGPQTKWYLSSWDGDNQVLRFMSMYYRA